MNTPTRAAFAITSLAVCPAFAQIGAGSGPISDLWKNNCSSCHGERAQGGGAGTRTLLTPEFMEPAKDLELDRRFFEAVKNGHPDNGMPAFGATLKDEQIWGLIVYLRELQHAHAKITYPKPDADGVFTSKYHKYRQETVISEGLDVPWSVDFGTLNGKPSMLVTNRPGPIFIFADGKLGPAIANTPKVRNAGQGGMMDVAFHPDHAKNGWIYLAFSDIGTANKRDGMTKIVRGKIEFTDGKPAWTAQETIFEAKQEHYLATAHHFGSRIVFTDPVVDGPNKGKRYVFFSIGERGREQFAQDLTRPNGKIYRLFDDGSVPGDNPFVDTKDAYPAIWSSGHRNPQGLAFDLKGNLWDTEHGPRGGDEVNLIQKGKNYGWPTIAYSINYNGAPFKTPWTDNAKGTSEGLEQPVSRWLPSIGACGLDVARGPAFPNWKGDLLAGGLSGQNVDRIRIVDGKITERETLIKNEGRVRDVVCGPDGAIYVVLNDPDNVVKLVPAENK